MLLHMRTTLQLPEQLWRSAKARAAREGSTLTQIVESALRAYLRPAQNGKAFRLRWRSERGELQPGLDINSRRGLNDSLGVRGDEFRD